MKFGVSCVVTDAAGLGVVLAAMKMANALDIGYDMIEEREETLRKLPKRRRKPPVNWEKPVALLAPPKPGMSVRVRALAYLSGIPVGTEVRTSDMLVALNLPPQYGINMMPFMESGLVDRIERGLYRRNRKAVR